MIPKIDSSGRISMNKTEHAATISEMPRRRNKRDERRENKRYARRYDKRQTPYHRKFWGKTNCRRVSDERIPKYCCFTKKNQKNQAKTKGIANLFVYLEKNARMEASFTYR